MALWSFSLSGTTPLPWRPARRLPGDQGKWLLLIAHKSVLARRSFGKAFSRLCRQNHGVGSLWVKGLTPLQRGRRAEAGPGPYRIHPWLDHLEAGINDAHELRCRQNNPGSSFQSMDERYHLEEYECYVFIREIVFYYLTLD